MNLPGGQSGISFLRTMLAVLAIAGGNASAQDEKAVPLDSEGCVRSFWILGPFRPFENDDYAKEGYRPAVDPKVKALSEEDVSQAGVPLGWQMSHTAKDRKPEDNITGSREDYLAALAKDEKNTDAALRGGDGKLTSVLLGRRRGDAHVPYLKARPAALEWKRVVSPSGSFDFNCYMGVTDSANLMAYLYAEIVSESDLQDVTVWLTADDQACVYLNGELVAGKDEAGGSAEPVKSTPRRLKAGRNALLVRAVNQGGDWSAGVRLTDSKGRPIPGLKSIPAWPENGLAWTDLSAGLKLDNPRRCARSIVSALYVDSGRNTLYAGVNNRGLFCSKDSGLTWSQAGQADGARVMEQCMPSQIWVDPEGAEPAVIIVSATYGLKGLFGSYDGGKTWQVMSEFPVTSFSVDASDKERKTILASRQWARGVWLTADAGKTWKDVSAGFPERAPNRDQPNWVWGVGLVNSTTFLAACGDMQSWAGNGIWRTTDSGAKWEQVCPVNVMGALSIAGGRLVWGGRSQHVVLSADGGKTWSLSSVPDVAYDGSVVLGKTGEWSCYLAYPKLYLSADQGATWNEAAMPALEKSPWGNQLGAWGLGSAVIDSKNGFLFVGANDKGLFRAKLPPFPAASAPAPAPKEIVCKMTVTDGQIPSWKVAAPLSHRQPGTVMGLRADDLDVEKTVAGGSVPGRIGTNDWVTMDGSAGGCEFSAAYGSLEGVLGYALSYIELAEEKTVRFDIAYDDAMRLWIDGVLVFERTTSAGQKAWFPPVLTLGKGIHSVLAKVANMRESWLFNMTLKDLEGKPVPFKSWPDEKPASKGDPIWTDITGNLPLAYDGDKGPARRQVTCVAFNPKDRKVLFAGLDQGGGIWKSADEGKAWVKINEGTNSPPNCGYLWKIWVDPADPNHLMTCAMYGKGLMRSRDGGKNWETINGSFVDQFWVAESDPERKTILAGLHEQQTIQRTLDGGKTWTNITAKGITSNGSHAMAMYALDALTYFVSFDRWGGFAGDTGFWKTEDAGRTWKLLNLPCREGDKDLPEKKFHCATGVAVADDGTFYLGGTGCHLIVGKERGKTLALYHRPTGWTMNAPGPAAFSEGFVYIADGYRLLISIDGGKTFRIGKGRDKGGCRGYLLADDRRKLLYMAAGPAGVFRARIAGLTRGE